MANKLSPTKPQAEIFFMGGRPPSSSFIASCLALFALSWNLLFSVVSCTTNNRQAAITYPAHVQRETRDVKTQEEADQGVSEPGFVPVAQLSQEPEPSENTVERAESSRTNSERRQPDNQRPQDGPAPHGDLRPKTAPQSEMDSYAKGRESKGQKQTRHLNNDKTAPVNKLHGEHDDHNTKAKADLPELRLIYSYSNPEHNLEARVFFQSGGEIGCASRQITKHFVRREVTETKNQCFKKSIWKKVEEGVKKTRLFSSKSKYRCKNPGERRATITLSVLEKNKSVTIGPICEDEKDDLPDSLKKLLALIQKLTLTLR